MELRHIEAVSRLIGVHRRLLRPESLNDAQEVLTLVRSIVSRDSVVVPRKEIEAVNRGMMCHPMTVLYIEARKILDRWLTSDTSKQGTENG
jgi:hypothetical protein